MSFLFNLQNKLQSYLLNLNDQIEQNVVSTDKVSAKDRLLIYGNAYKSRLIESLAASYPVLQTYLGCEKFEKLAGEYINKYPSNFRSIRWFGNKLDMFLNEHPAYQNHSYLSELAKFEWTLALVFDSADRDIITLDAISSIPPDSWAEMQLVLHPSVNILNFTWNIVDIWQSISQDKSPPAPRQNELNDEYWVLWRKDLVNKFCSVKEDEAWAINSISKGISFGEICEGLCQWIDEKDAPVRASSLLKGWILAGLITNIELKHSCIA